MLGFFKDLESRLGCCRCSSTSVREHGLLQNLLNTAWYVSEFLAVAEIKKKIKSAMFFSGLSCPNLLFRQLCSVSGTLSPSAVDNWNSMAPPAKM